MDGNLTHSLSFKEHLCSGTPKSTPPFPNSSLNFSTTYVGTFGFVSSTQLSQNSAEITSFSLVELFMVTVESAVETSTLT